jgi:hypothetical protein
MTIAEVLQKLEEGRERLRDEGRRDGQRDGRREGRREGERELLLRARFGELPPATVARIEAAELEALEAWGLRLMTAGSVDEVLGAS